MTKRFTIEQTTINDCIVDNTTGEQLDSVDYTERLCEVLNALHEERNYFERKKEEFLSKWSIANTENIQLRQENEQLKQQKSFLKIHDDYFIQYGDDNELFNLHKPSDIRSLIYLINRENGYDELECEYNEEGYGND